MRKIVVLVIVLVLVPVDSRPQTVFIDPNDPKPFRFLVTQCRMETPYCLGYVNASVAWLSTISGLLMELKPDHVIAEQTVCLKEKTQHTTLRDYMKIIAKYGENHPETLSLDAAIGTYEAIVRAFPCR